MDKIIIVAQAPSQDSKEPLEGASGRRLAALAGLDHEVFLDRFEHVNLLAVDGDRFDLAAARARADELRVGWRGRKAVLLGRGVMAAFRLLPDDAEWFQAVEVPPGVEVACMPHPGGVSAWWNDETNVERARQFMLRLNVGFLAPIQRGRNKLPTGRPEVFTPEQVAAALLASDGILTAAAKMLAEETGMNCERQNVSLYCHRYPDLAALRDRCRESIGDVAEQNVWRAVREGDPDISMKLLRCKMFAGRGYELMIEGRLKHEGQVNVSVDVRVQIADMRDELLREAGLHAKVIEHVPSVRANGGNGHGAGGGNGAADN